MVTAMEWPPVLGRAELRVLLDVSDTRIQQFMVDGFPEAIANLKSGRIWATKDVIAWCEQQGRTVHQPRA